MKRKLRALVRISKAYLSRPGLWRQTMKWRYVKKLYQLLFRYRPATFLKIVSAKIHLAIQSDKILHDDPIATPWIAKARDLEAAYPGITHPVALGNIDILEDKFKAPPYQVNQNAPQRINILLPHLDPLIMFGGYIACLHFIRKVQSAGFRVRLLLMETGRYNRDAVLAKLASNPPLQDAIKKVEVEDITLGDYKLKISPNDSFVGYSFWTCLKAHRLASAIRKSFIFFIQEYEPIFHPLESHYAIGNYVYRLPHKAIFNTQLLADYFKRMEIGVFGQYSGAELAANHVAFQHALTPTKCPTAQ